MKKYTTKKIITECRDIADLAEKGFTDTLIAILDRRNDINYVNDDGFNLLHIASKTGNVKLAKYLLDKGADVNAVSEDGYKGFSLMYAVRSRNAKMVKLLLDYGADVSKADLLGCNSLEHLCKIANKPVNENIRKDMVKITNMLSKRIIVKNKYGLKMPITILSIYAKKGCETSRQMVDILMKNLYQQQEIEKREKEKIDNMMKTFNEENGIIF